MKFEDESLAALLAAPAPREVPAELMRRAVRQACPVKILMFGAAFFLVGLLVAASVFPRRFWRDLQLDLGGVRASGRITAVTKTVQWKGGGKGVRSSPVYEYDFVFNIKGSSVEFPGVCYTTGSWRSDDGAADVVYLASNPSVARLVGTRLDRNTPNGVLSLVLPLLGIATMTAFSIKRGRTRRLLRRGSVAEANVTGCEPFRGKGRVPETGYRITLRRTDDPDAPPWILQTYRPGIMALASERLGSKRPVFVIYDPKKFDRIFLPESLSV